MKVIFNTSVSGNGFSYRKGEEGEIDNELAKDLVKAGFCVPVKQGREKLTVKKEKAVL